MGACISKTKAFSAARQEKSKAAKKNKAAEESSPKDVPQESKATAEVVDTTKPSEEPAKDADKAPEGKTEVAGEKPADAGEKPTEASEKLSDADDKFEDASDKFTDADEKDGEDVEETVVDNEGDEPAAEADVKPVAETADKDDVTPVADPETSASRALEVEAAPENVDEKAEDAKVEELSSENKKAIEAEAEAAAAAEAAKAAEAEAKAAELEALMVGTLSAVRAGIAECTAAAAAEDPRKFAVAFSSLTLAIRHEMVLEEEAYFPLVDKYFDGAAADLLDAHRKDEELENVVDEALLSKSEYRAAFDAWREHHLAHITRELAELRAPLAGLARKMGGAKAAATALGKAALAPRMKDITWFATWNVATLRKHATFDELVSWVSTLRRIATVDQWSMLSAAVLKPLTEDDQARLQTELEGVSSLVA